MQQGNLKEELRELVEAVAELKRHEDPKTAMAADCEHWNPAISRCSVRIGGGPPVEVWNCPQSQCPATCDAFKPRAKGGRHA